MSVRRDQIALWATLFFLAAVPLLAAALNQEFYADFFIRIMIYAIAAMSLGIILGFGGMPSFGHAVYLGIGAYAIGILSSYGITNGAFQFAVAVFTSAVAALIIGFISIRTTGIHFIMITLAFGQMVYFFMFSLKTFGGDDGMNILKHSNFGGMLDLSKTTTMYYFVFAILCCFYFLGDRMIRSQFGLVLRGTKSNLRRMAAIGFPTFRYRLTAFVISGAMCGVAGALSANQTLFVSPALMHWTRSGELLIIVIVGGVGSLFGPVVGAIVYLTLEYVLSAYVGHWQGVLGTLIILLVLFGRDGLSSFISTSDQRIPKPREG